MNKFIKNTITLVKKNIRLLIRAKASALIVILGPLLIIFLAGLAFDNTNLYAVKVGTFSEKYNELSNSFVDRLVDAQFKVTRFPEEDKCRSAIERGEVHTCVVFSPDFTMAKDNSNELSFYVDYSQINLVWSVLNAMTEEVTEKSMELSRNLTTILVNALEYSSTQVKEKRPSLINLTTSNDLVNRRVTDVSIRLEEVSLDFDPGAFGTSDLSSQKGKVKHWVDASINLGSQAISDAKSFVGNANDVVQASSISGEQKQSLKDLFESAIDELNEMEGKFGDTKSLAESQFNELNSLIDTLVGKITQTKAQMDQIDAAHDTSLAELGDAKTALDGSLKNLLDVQRALNNIDNIIRSIEVKDPEAVVQPIVTNIKPVISEQSYLNYIFPSLIVLIIMFTALLLAPTLILLEKKSPAYFRNFMAPVNGFTYLFATFVTCFLLLILQSVIILAIAAVFFSSQLLAGIHYTIILVFLVIALFSAIGMMVGYIFNSEETSALGAISLGSIFLFLSDVIIPIESMPSWFMAIAELNPFVVCSDLLRSTIIYDLSIFVLWQKLILLVFLVFIAAALACSIYYFSRNKLIYKTFRKKS
ncbi:ABC transporter permease [Candidatus Woesearchaeota archaeon]|nr:ABC transporter permease [Candidatus Woesearchaeota archaeon]